MTNPIEVAAAENESPRTNDAAWQELDAVEKNADAYYVLKPVREALILAGAA